MEVAFHLSQIRADEVRKALRNIENLREDKPGAEIHAVSNTSAVTMMKKDGSFKDKIEHLIDEKDIIMKACSNSIEGTDMKEDLIDGVEVVSSGVSELSRLQSEENSGYIKP